MHRNYIAWSTEKGKAVERQRRKTTGPVSSGTVRAAWQPVAEGDTSESSFFRLGGKSFLFFSVIVPHERDRKENLQMKRFISLAILLALVAVLLAPVSQAANPASSAAASANRTPLLYTGAKSEIDATDKDQGRLVIRYLKECSKKLKVKITKYDKNGSEGLAYIYDLNGKAKAETYSLTEGSGKYLVKVLENIEGDRYAIVQSQTLDVVLADDLAPYLIPIQYINYNDASKAVIKAKELTKNCKSELEKVQVIYQYILNNVVYDYDKAKKVVAGELNGYVPTVDVILDSKKGICFDYSSLMGAMLRSVGIPTKLIMGYVAPNNAYHAWNDVYIKGKGWIRINSAVYFDGKTFSRMDSTFAAANKSGKQTDFIGNGKNYSPLYQY